MDISHIPFDEVGSLPHVSFSSAARVNLFEKLSTNGCLLDCQSWALSQHHTNKRAAARKELWRDKVKKQRQKMKAGNKVSNARLKNIRDPFTVDDLENSAAQGCGVCRFFNSLVLAIFPANAPGTNPRHLQLQWYGYGFALQARDEKLGTSFSFHFFSPEVNQSVVKGLSSGNILSGDTSSPASLSRAKLWIENCEASHPRCASGRNVPLPKRCLDVGPPHATQIHADVRLAETEGLSGTYMCLSHCWGTEEAKPIQTTSENMQGRLAGIPFASLPQTFADAVVMARQLDVRYLWIDSLCIVQNSEADWQAESGKMATIYRGSFATIAAISSHDSRGGCFSRKASSTSLSPRDLCFRIQGGGEDTFETVIAARCCDGDGIIDNLDLFRLNFPALSRAWIFQERILSRRIIYCTRHELQFECRQGVTCECGNSTKPPHPKPGTESCWSMSQSKQMYAQMEHVSSHDSQLQLEHWQRMVMQYTKLQLTKGSDKLPAFSGCATSFDRYSVRYNGRYLAGLWETTFAQGLLWLVNMPFRCPRPSWRAPSWSWAAVDTPHGITYINVACSVRRQPFQQTIEAIECTPEGADRTGKVRRRPACHMRVRASLVPTYVRRVCRTCARSRTGMWTIEQDRWLTTRHPSVSPCPPDGHAGLRLGDDVETTFNPDYRYKEGDLELEPKPGGRLCRHARVYLLYLYDSRQRKPEFITHYFVVLHKVIQPERAVAYERIGLFNIGFKTEAQSDKWFAEEYAAVTEKTALITVV